MNKYGNNFMVRWRWSWPARLPDAVVVAAAAATAQRKPQRAEQSAREARPAFLSDRPETLARPAVTGFWQKRVSQPFQAPR